MADYVGALDQGTTSTRFMIFDHAGQVVADRSEGARADLPEARMGRARPRWRSGPARQEVIAGALKKAGHRRRATSPRSASRTSARPRSCGTGPRGKPIHNALVWQDTRTDQICNELSADGGQDRFRDDDRTSASPRTSRGRRSAGSSTTSRARGLAPKRASWLFGNIDTWCIWNLTGGVDGGAHVTDVTNASRTMLMDLETLDWDDVAARRDRGARARCCPRSARRARSTARRSAQLAGVPVAGDLGDQQAALFGQTCFDVGEAKNTYGTGNFLLLNTGTEAVPVEERPDHGRGVQDRRPAGRVHARGLDRDHRAPSCSGCATT